MIFTDEGHFVRAIQELLPFPPNLKVVGKWDFNKLVDLLIEHYEAEKSPLSIDFDSLYQTPEEIRALYDGIFFGLDLKGKAMMYPIYRKPEGKAEAVTFEASDLYRFLLEEHLPLTGRHKLVGVGEEDVVFVFFDHSIIVNIDHLAKSLCYISKIGRKAVSGTHFIRPTLLWGMVFYWPGVLEKGMYSLIYDPSYSPDELSELAMIVDELLEFPPGVEFGKKYPVIVENVALRSCERLRDLLNSAGVKVFIEERKEFTNIIRLGMSGNQTDLIDNN